MVIGLGTLLNVVAIGVGTTAGVLLGDRVPARTRAVVTDGLGLVTLLVAAGQVAAVDSPDLRGALGRLTLVVVLLAVLVGGIIGSLARLEDRLEGLGATLQRWLSRGRTGGPERARFVEGFVAASLVFCIGPVAILGSLQDGLHGDIELLAIKSALDGFAALAFASALGWGVGASVVPVAIYQGTLTVAAAISGDALSAPVVAVVTAVGGLLLVGVSLRLLELKKVPVGDLLPALLLAPLLTLAVQSLR